MEKNIMLTDDDLLAVVGGQAEAFASIKAEGQDLRGFINLYSKGVTESNGANRGWSQSACGGTTLI